MSMTQIDEKTQTVQEARAKILKRCERNYKSAFTRTWNQENGAHGERRVLHLIEAESEHLPTGSERLEIEVRFRRNSALHSLDRMCEALIGPKGWPSDMDATQEATLAGKQVATEAVLVVAVEKLLESNGLAVDPSTLERITGPDREQYHRASREEWEKAYDLTDRPLRARASRVPGNQ
jgi:hypothetical protein